MGENLQTTDPNAIGVFRVNHDTTASVTDSGTVTIRQVRRVARNVTDGTRVETQEVIVKLDARDFARIGRMVGVLAGEA